MSMYSVFWVDSGVFKEVVVGVVWGMIVVLLF